MQFVQLLLGKIQKIGSDKTPSQEKRNAPGHILFYPATDRQHHGEGKQPAQNNAEETGSHGDLPQKIQTQQQGNGQKEPQPAGEAQKSTPEYRYCDT